MVPALLCRQYGLIPIAETGAVFSDLGPYVAAINDRGVVAFRATLRSGGAGIFAGDGGAIATLLGPDGPLLDITSHPDINQDGACSVYAVARTGDVGVFRVREGQVAAVASGGGPLGPTMNDDGVVAFRAALPSGGCGVFAGCDGRVRTIADTRGEFCAFHGLPVINDRGAVTYCGELRAGGRRIEVCDGESRMVVAETGKVFAGLGAFPALNDAGAVGFCATLPDGWSGVFVSYDGSLAALIDTTGDFESFRGVLLDGNGGGVFYGTPRGGTLGVFSGPDPRAHRVVGIGMSLLGSTVVDFALNPVSINNAGQLAVRVGLADGRQVIVRADPLAD